MLLFLQAYNIKITFICYLFNVLFISDIISDKSIKVYYPILKYHDIDTKHTRIQIITKNCRILAINCQSILTISINFTKYF